MVDTLEHKMPRWFFLAVYGTYASIKNTYNLLIRYGFMKSGFIWKSIDRSGSPVPWFSYPAIEYLEGLDLSSYDVLEYGSGYSTVYWSRQAKSVIAIENNAAWAGQMRPQLGPNARIQLIESESGYATAISEMDGRFDLIVIDGLDRMQCVRQALPKLRGGGIIILDDADRYPDITKLLREHHLLQVDFAGFNPINTYTKTTSFFFHRDFQPKPRNKILPLHSWGYLKVP